MKLTPKGIRDNETFYMLLLNEDNTYCYFRFTIPSCAVRNHSYRPKMFNYRFLKGSKTLFNNMVKRYDTTCINGYCSSLVYFYQITKILVTDCRHIDGTAYVIVTDDYFQKNPVKGKSMLKIIRDELTNKLASDDLWRIANE